MVDRGSGDAVGAAAGRIFVAVAAWVSLTSAAMPWRTDGGVAEIGLSRVLGVQGLGTVDPWAARAAETTATVHWLDAWLLPVAAVALLAGAVRWRRGGLRPEVLFGGVVTLLLGIAALAMHLIGAGSGALGNGSYLATAAGAVGIAGWGLGQRTELGAVPDRPGETGLLHAITDVDLDRHVTPRLLRLVWSLAATLVVAGFVVTAVAGVFDVLTTGEYPVVEDALAAVGIVVAGLAITVVALLLLRLVIELLVVPFRIVDLLAARPTEAASADAVADAAPAATAPEPDPSAEPAPSDEVPPPARGDRPPEPEPDGMRDAEPVVGAAPGPTADDQPELVTADEIPPGLQDRGDEPAEPEPWSASLPPPPPPPRLEGPADRWFRQGDEERPAVPEAIGVPDDDPDGHPLRRRRSEDDGS